MQIKNLVNNIFKEENLSWSIHDLRMTDGESNINIIFDMVVAFEASQEEIIRVTNLIKNAIKQAVMFASKDVISAISDGLSQTDGDK